MPTALIGGTGIYRLPGIEVEARTIKNEYGEVQIYVGQGDLEDVFFLTRHGQDHSKPPHQINYRANIKAIKDLGVQRIVST